MTLDELRWLAATIDCEGTIGIYGSGPQAGPIPFRYYRPAISVQMTHQEYVATLWVVSGCGTVTGPYSDPAGIYQQRWNWSVDTGHMLEFCRAIYTYLIIKKHQALLVEEYLVAKANGYMTQSLGYSFYIRSSNMNHDQFGTRPGPGRPRKG
jgi:hypothetical protein